MEEILTQLTQWGGIVLTLVIALVMLIISFLLLLMINIVQVRQSQRTNNV